jgi:hypothetical protein
MNNLPIFVAPPHLRLLSAPASSTTSGETTDLLRQLLEVQRDQLALARQTAAAADSQTRWRNFLQRWREEFPEVGAACKEVLPIVERTYLRMIQELADRLRGDEPEDLDNEYVLSEFLDRYGMKLSQLSTIVGQLSPIADAAPVPSEPATEEPEPQ